MTNANNRPWAACGAFFLACVIAAGAGAQAQTLEEALAQAYLGNPDLRAARARLRATDETVPQALSNWRPVVSVRGDIGVERSTTDLGTPGPGSPEAEITQPRGAALVIDQNLYRGGRTVASTRQAENVVQSERARLSAVEQAVLLDTVTAYMDVVRDEAIVDLNQSNVSVLERQLEATQDRFRVGEVTRTDVSQSESRLARGRADLTRARGALIQSRAAFANIVGQAPVDLRPAQPPADIYGSQQEAMDEASAENFDVVSTRYAEAAARNQVRVVTGELLPLVTLQGQIFKDQERINRFSDEEGAAIVAQLTVPLYQAGAVSSRIREAKQVVLQRRNEYQQAVRNSVEAAARAWEALQTARAQIRSFSAEIRAAEIALEGVRQEALVGSRTVLDVLDAEQELFQARVNLVVALRDEVVTAYQLRAAGGDLTARALGLPVPYYDPTDHYERVRDKWFGLGIEEREDER